MDVIRNNNWYNDGIRFCVGRWAMFNLQIDHWTGNIDAASMYRNLHGGIIFQVDRELVAPLTIDMRHTSTNSTEMFEAFREDLVVTASNPTWKHYGLKEAR